jgi:very-short-patch-repair endonuclease
MLDSASQSGEMLVAIMNKKRDFKILREQGWYRVPVMSVKWPWPPTWVAFYQTSIFGQEAYAVNYYGRVRDFREITRAELFPGEKPNPRIDPNKKYYQIFFDSLVPLYRPIYSRRWRYIVFIPTTREKFDQAIEINDLYHESSLEDRLWAELRYCQIDAERQLDIKLRRQHYKLDFAVFCQKSNIDIEVDGEAWHSGEERHGLDRQRNNALAVAGWQVLRFSGHEIREQLAEYCVPSIKDAIKTLGGLRGDNSLPRGTGFAVCDARVQYNID